VRSHQVDTTLKGFSLGLKAIDLGLFRRNEKRQINQWC